MQEVLRIKGTDEFPEILFDPTNQKFEISGRSLPENVNIAYEPVMKWLTEYLVKPNPTTEIKFKLDYYNSGSAKKLMQLLFLLEDAHEKGVNINVLWYYGEEDETMEIKGRELMKAVRVPFDVKVC
jgi:hypothetical protein